MPGRAQSECPHPSDLPLSRPLDLYLQTGRVRRQSLREFAEALGCEFVNVNGVLLARRPDGRITAAADSRAHSKGHALPSTPCWTCGAAPRGTYPDESPRYGCSPHQRSMEPGRVRAPDNAQ